MKENRERFIFIFIFIFILGRGLEQYKLAVRDE